jgi:hypothetical protein
MTNSQTYTPTATAACSTRADVLADMYVVSDIEVLCPNLRLPDDTRRWYDSRPMLDPREHSQEVIDMATLAIEHGLERGLLQRHPQQAHLLNVCKPPTAELTDAPHDTAHDAPTHGQAA